LSDNVLEDVLIYAQFPQIGLKFLENRNNPDAFEPAPWLETAAPVASVQPQAPVTASEAYQITVNGKAYDVTVSSGGAVTGVAPVVPSAPQASAPASNAQPVPAPLAGNIFKVMAVQGQSVAAGDVIMIMEAMKMETEIRSPTAGVVAELLVKEGDAVQVGQALLTLS
jgi:oxaloacetate decarboxylase alpha subunit